MNWIEKLPRNWTAPALPADGSIPHGDMPGDSVQIGEKHIQKAGVIFPELMRLIRENPAEKIVVAVSGGSGVGKSETASLLAYYFHQLGVGAYTLSGDNYPRRIPAQNDAERERVFRNSGVRAMLAADVYTAERAETLRALWETGEDADPARAANYPWLGVYQKFGRIGLEGYLGTDREQDFAHLNDILAQFHQGAQRIWLRRMGRTPDALWYDEVDFSDVHVLLVEWTHGNSRHLRGVDLPILLNSTPEETRAHRRSRARDGKVDSPFTTMVLEIEQGILHSRAEQAKIIVSKAGELLTFEEYSERMEEVL